MEFLHRVLATVWDSHLEWIRAVWQQLRWHLRLQHALNALPANFCFDIFFISLSTAVGFDIAEHSYRVRYDHDTAADRGPRWHCEDEMASVHAAFDGLRFLAFSVRILHKDWCCRWVLDLRGERTRMTLSWLSQ